MSLFSSEQLARFEEQGEESFHNECHCLIDRIALPIEENESLYTLPNEVVDIRRVTYRGIRIYPISHRSMRKYFDGINPTGTPTNYIYDNNGELVIKLFPTPAETIAPVQANLMSRDVIQTQCIVEYYLMPDGVGFKLPSFIRRRLLKAYVLKCAFSVEGKGQNLKAAKYWSDKWDYMMEAYCSAVRGLISTPRKLIASNLDYDLVKQLRVPRPVLPMSMIGLDVDDEYLNG